MVKWVLGIVGAAILIFGGYTWFVLHWSYSKGERAGYVQKLSKKGWICKTWEGEMALVSMPGTVAEKFAFTVPTDSVAQEINRSLGNRVSLTYEQHLGIPISCFADTQYFITRVTPVDDGHASPAPGVLAAPPSAPGATQGSQP
jgi:hypothetical protein